MNKKEILEIFNKTKPDTCIDNCRSGEVLGIVRHYLTGLKGVDIGSGPAPTNIGKPIDNGPVLNAFNIGENPDSLDFVFSSHCIEHLNPNEWPKALEHWWNCLKKGGVLFLYLPHEESGWNPSKNPEIAKWHLWQPTNKNLLENMAKYSYEPIIIDDAINEFGSFMFIVRKI